jgi:hypothetical protein
VILTELLRHLPCDNPKVMAVTLNQLEQKLLWVASHSSISTSFVDLRRDAARKIVTDALHAAVQDLEDMGHFQSETILRNKILE